MSYYPGRGVDVDALTSSFGRMGMGAPGGYGMPPAGYGMGAPASYSMPTGYGMRMAPAPVPRVKFSASFKNDERDKPLDITGVIRMLDMPPAALRMIIAMCDLPNGDTIEIHIIYTHKGRREAGAYEFHIVAMYHYNTMNRPYARNPDGSVHMLANGTPDRIDSMFIELPKGAHGTAYALNVLYNIFGGYLMPAEQGIVQSRLGRAFYMMPGLLDNVLRLRVSGGAARSKRGRSMTRKGKGKRKATRRRGRKN
jgi:hypothetical protein